MPKAYPDRTALTATQTRKLGAMLAVILPANAFYARKFRESGLSAEAVQTVADLRRLPFTVKDELSRDQEAHPPFGTNLTDPLENYTRLHQTSGTTGRPLRWLDTAESWAWWMRCWTTIYDAAGIGRGDRLLIPATFGPFVGFWGAFEGALHRGMMAMAGGGMTSTARLRFLTENGATVLLTTPSYALRLAEVAHQEGIDLAAGPVRALMVAGEPGGSVPAIRTRIERAWGAELFDHTGMTEIGPVGFECRAHPGGVHLNESEWIVEVVEPGGEAPVGPGTEGELVLTNLGRWCMPLLRYRTGDVVRLTDEPCPCGRHDVRMEGGILGRVDQMVHIKGNNVYPRALEAVVWAFDEVVEFRATIVESGATTSLTLEIEPAPDAEGEADRLAERVSGAIRDALHFRVDVQLAAPGSLPRFEGKGRRFVRTPNDRGKDSRSRK